MHNAVALLQAGGAAGVLAYIRSHDPVERLFLVRAASKLNELEQDNSERRDHNLAVGITNGLLTGRVD